MKIGIITMYYNSVNYGGLLQAFALCAVLKKYGYDAEQISYNNKEGFVKRFAKRLLKHHDKNTNESVSEYRRIIKLREAAIKTQAEHIIPHSNTVYSNSTIYRTNNIYTAFIAGSDQIWNSPSVGYFLNFVNGNNKRIAYAASIGKKQIEERLEEKYKSAFEKFNSISVREESTKKIVQRYTDKNVFVVFDPVLLVEKEEWNEIREDSGINEDYLFCYFLGSDDRLRKLAVEFANNERLKIVSFPHLNGYVKNDVAFGDYQVFDGNLGVFIDCIARAKCVFTDSFHATVFSSLYNVPFVSFSRKGKEQMDGRITDYLDLIGNRKRFCHDERDFSLAHILSVWNIECIERQDFLEKKEQSILFLLNSLNG
ncbi:MAG: polysaccharide pyruvyl transferase family protein [Prolixibacteraceae bacterium]|nr:polysaccharide pyruvyl transferase family protein [Prolixibacteraceae bacterium]